MGGAAISANKTDPSVRTVSVSKGMGVVLSAVLGS